MKNIVAGGAGFIGSNLVEGLVSRGEDISVIDNLQTGNTENLRSVFNKIKFFNDDVNNLYKKYKNADIIYHLGMPSSTPMYKENPRLVVNVVGSAISVFEFARKYDSKVVYASTSSLYNGKVPPHNERMQIDVTDYYTEARYTLERIAELYNKLYGVKSVGLRFFSVYGQHEEFKGKYANIITQFLNEIRNGKSPVIYGNGNQRRDFIYVKDVVRAILFSGDHLDSGYDILNVGTGISYSFNDIVRIINEILGTKIEPIYVDIPIKNYVQETQADMTKFNKLGFKSEYDLRRGIEELI